MTRKQLETRVLPEFVPAARLADRGHQEYRPQVAGQLKFDRKAAGVVQHPRRRKRMHRTDTVARVRHQCNVVKSTGCSDVWIELGRGGHRANATQLDSTVQLIRSQSRQRPLVETESA